MEKLVAGRLDQNPGDETVKVAVESCVEEQETTTSSIREVKQNQQTRLLLQLLVRSGIKAVKENWHKNHVRPLDSECQYIHR